MYIIWMWYTCAATGRSGSCPSCTASQESGITPRQRMQLSPKPNISANQQLLVKNRLQMYGIEDLRPCQSSEVDIKALIWNRLETIHSQSSQISCKQHDSNISGRTSDWPASYFIVSNRLGLVIVHDTRWGTINITSRWKAAKVC